MSLIRLGLDEARREEKRSITLEDFPHFKEMFPSVAAGVAVNQATAETVTAYRNGIVVISGTLGVLDRDLWRRVGDNDREKAEGHPVQRVLHEPNEYTTAQVFWETIFAHAVSWGNGYAEIEWDNALRPIALWNVTPDRIEPVAETVVDASGRRRTRLWYKYDGKRVINPEDIIHIPGPGFDGVRGYSPAALFRQALGLSIAAERFGASFFGNGATPGMAVQHPGRLSNEAQARLALSLNSAHQGADRAHKTIILEEGMTVARPVTIPPEDAQFLETRAFQVEEVARMLNLPPHKLKHRVGERPGGNIEAEQINFLTDTLLPWVKRAEQECSRKLISKAQRSSYYIEHEFKDILRVDVQSRTAAQKVWFDMGVVDADQIARQENLPKPKPKEPTPQVPPASEPLAEPSADRAARAEAWREVLAEVSRRLVKRESEAAKRASKKGPATFETQMDEFYSGHADMIAACVEPYMRFALADAGLEGDAKALSRELSEGYVLRSKGELMALKASEITTAVPRLMEKWLATRTVEMVEQIAAVAAEEKRDVA